MYKATKLKAKLGIFISYFVLLQFDIYSQNVTTHRQPCDKVEYHLYIHSIAYFDKQTNAPKYLDLSALPSYIDYINNLFKETCIQFKTCTIDSIPDYNYIGKGEKLTPEDTNVHEMYRQPYSINMYWVDISYAKKTTFNGICADTQSNAFIFVGFHPSGNPLEVQFTEQIVKFFGIDFLDPAIFQKPILPYKCGKLNREQRDYIIYKDRLCRKKRWLNASP